MIAIQPVSSIRGWRVDQVLTQRLLFDLESIRDLETEGLMRQHAELVARREWQELTLPEKNELIRLESTLAERLTAPGESVEERTQRAEMNKYVKNTLAELGEGK